MAAAADAGDAFGACRAGLDALIGVLEGDEGAAMTHAELEARVQRDGREVLRLAVQGHLDVRHSHEPRRAAVIDTDGVRRGTVEADHERLLATVFGEVTIGRLAYRRRGHPNLHPADAELNLPVERHSHGLRQLAAIEATRGSFDGAADAIERGTSQRLGKRQVEQLTERTAVDFDTFYATAARSRTQPGDVVVVSCDGKGIVMRADSLRPATAEAAANSKPKLDTRLSKGEKRNRKRLAEVGAVYDVKPSPRTIADILTTSDDLSDPTPPPLTRNKWLTASVANDAATVITSIFDEAERRDPQHQRPWVALVDGNNHQIRRITAEAQARQINITIVVDVIHVLEYLWKAAWSFHDEGDPAAQAWVHSKASAVLAGRSSEVAAAIRRKATCLHLDPTRRANADTCADYLLAKKAYLDYPTALRNGWPIATGVIEGACRHLIKDRLDITGARWSVNGAEAILKLRAIRTNGDWPEYWTFHLANEQQRIHASRYDNGVIPAAA